MKRTIVAALVLLSSAATVADFDIDAYCKEAGAGGPAAAAGTSLITNYNNNANEGFRMADKSAQVRLAECIAKYSPEVRAVAEAALKKMRGRLPGAVETVYDNYNALAIAFGPTDRRSDVVCSITLYPRWVSLFFARGASLPDPQKILKGSGTTVRHIVLEDVSILDQPAVRALVTQAVKAAGTRFDTSAARQVVIKSVARTRRPRRPASAASRSARSAR